MTVEFKFALRERVKVRMVSEEGRVEVLQHTPAGNIYQVLYWMEGDRRVEWLYEDELAPLPQHPLERAMPFKA